jgi:4'-phosphopantetheinyl transferase
MTCQNGAIAAADSEAASGTFMDIETVTLTIRSADQALGSQEILSPSEHTRLANMHEGARPAFVTARGMLRTALGEYMGLTPSAVPLVQEGAGRVFLDGFKDDEPPFYSVSHTGGAEDGIAAVAVAESCAIGVDIQQVDPTVDWRRIAERRYPAEEWALLSAMPEEEGCMLFFTLWAIKESFVKMEDGALMPYLRGVELDFTGGELALKSPTPGGCSEATIYFHFIPEFQLAVVLVGAQKIKVVLDSDIQAAPRRADPLSHRGDQRGTL